MWKGRSCSFELKCRRLEFDEATKPALELAKCLAHHLEQRRFERHANAGHEEQDESHQVASELGRRRRAQRERRDQDEEDLQLRKLRESVGLPTRSRSRCTERLAWYTVVYS